MCTLKKEDISRLEYVEMRIKGEGRSEGVLVWWLEELV